ncbi:hypothetical protein ACLKA7_015298 [Drosophila subpalustris]
MNGQQQKEGTITHRLECRVAHAEKFTVNIPPSTSSARKDAKLFSFFDFGESAAEKSVEETPVRVELSHYINDLDESMESLNRYPTIKSAFFLYNTPLPSSAPVERLFSYAGMACPSVTSLRLHALVGALFPVCQRLFPASSPYWNPVAPTTLVLSRHSLVCPTQNYCQVLQVTKATSE